VRCAAAAAITGTALRALRSGRPAPVWALLAALGPSGRAPALAAAALGCAPQ